MEVFGFDIHLETVKYLLKEKDAMKGEHLHDCIMFYNKHIEKTIKGDVN